MLVHMAMSPKSVTTNRGRPTTPGSLRLLSEDDGTVWRLRVSLGRDPETNRYRTLQRNFHGSEAQARRALARLVTEVEDGKVTADRCTVKALFDRWLVFVESRDRSPKTLKDYRLMADWLIGQIGTMQIRNLTGSDLDGLIDGIRREKGQSSADHYYRMLRAALRQAVKWGLINQAPTERATAPSAPKPRATIPSTEDVHRLIKAAEDSGDTDLAALIWVAASTGMRRGELCALRVSDVDLVGAVVLIQRAVSVVNAKSHLREPKTGKIRRVSLDAATVEVLDRQIRKALRRDQLTELSGDPFLWSSAIDASAPKPPDSVTAAFNRLRDGLGLTGLHFHDIRHYNGSHLIAGGMDIATVAARLGHSPTMLMQTYAQVIDTRDQEAAAIMGRVLGTKGS